MPKSPYDFDVSSILSGGQEKKKPTRDSRRAFSQTQRNHIFAQQDGKCAECHEKLDFTTVRYHHAKPWAYGGRTITVNGRALCPNCHAKITHKERLKKVDKKRTQKQTNPFYVNLPKVKLPKGF